MDALSKVLPNIYIWLCVSIDKSYLLSGCDTDLEMEITTETQYTYAFSGISGIWTSPGRQK